VNLKVGICSSSSGGAQEKGKMKLSLPSKAAAAEALRKKGREDETQ
jgi:hypothetical protein